MWRDFGEGLPSLEEEGYKQIFRYIKHYQDGLGRTNKALKQKVDKWLLDVLSYRVSVSSAQGNECVCIWASPSLAPVLLSNIKDS